MKQDMEKRFDELPKIADTLDRIETMLKTRPKSIDALDFGLFIIIILLALILWRVW